MDRDDVIRMARVAGVHHINLDDDYIFTLERFVALVAAAEREACAALLLKIKQQCQDADRLWQVEEFIDAAIRARGGE